MLWLALHFPGLRNEALAPLAGWACQFTPRVAPAPPDALLAEIEASLRYFGGPDAFLRTLHSGLDALGTTASLAVAPTGLAALWLARGGIRAFTLRLVHFDSSFREIEIGLASPSRDAARLAALLRERLGASTLEQPVESLELHAADFTPLGPRSGGLFGDPAREEEDWARLLERLRIRLGGEAVCGLATQPDHRPEHAWRRVEPGEWDPCEFRQPGARPLWLLEQPRRLAESEFTLLAGLERIECGWWDGDEAQRDYFIARLANDAAGWIYREDGAWTLHGLFA